VLQETYPLRDLALDGFGVPGIIGIPWGTSETMGRFPAHGAGIPFEGGQAR